MQKHWEPCIGDFLQRHLLVFDKTPGRKVVVTLVPFTTVCAFSSYFVTFLWTSFFRVTTLFRLCTVLQIESSRGTIVPLKFVELHVGKSLQKQV